MLYGQPYTRFQDAYIDVLSQILTNYRYDTCGRGKDALEILNVAFSLADPVDRIPYIAARKSNVVFNHAEALWYLTGRDDLAMIAYYAPSLRTLSQDGATLTGTAYGPRLFHPSGPDGRSQFERIERLLREEPDSKRATMLIMRPDELVDPTNPDVACTLGLQFMLRQDTLHMTAYMRGNDAMIGLLGDTFAFTFIQEFTARRLGVRVGTYAHHVGSMHINKLDLPKVHEILTEARRPVPLPRYNAERMPETSWDEIHDVAAWEEQLRTDRARLTADKLNTVPVAPYWRRILALFEFYRQIQHQPDQPVSPDILTEMHPGHRWLATHRWPDRMPAGTAAVDA